MSGAKKRQTMAKMARERAVKEKRVLKAEKKQAAAHMRLLRATGQLPPEDDSDAEASAQIVEGMPDGSQNGGIVLPPAPIRRPDDA